MESINYFFQLVPSKGVFDSGSSRYPDTDYVVDVLFIEQQIGFEFSYNFVLVTSKEYCCVDANMRYTHSCASFLMPENVSKLEDIVLRYSSKCFSYGSC